MGMPYLKIDEENTEFELKSWGHETHVFPGTVQGAILLTNFCKKHKISALMSSDFNHPDEFPKFEKHSIDIVAGYYDDAIADGVIEIVK